MEQIKLFEVKNFEDNRGTLIFPNIKDFNALECTVSINKKNVFRGFHINDFAKHITCIQGEFLDIIINPETNEITKFNLIPGSQILIPKNFAHGFIALQENSIMIYHFNGIFKNAKPFYLKNFETVNFIMSDTDFKNLNETNLTGSTVSESDSSKNP